MNICTKLELFCLGRVLVDQHLDLLLVGPQYRERGMGAFGKFSALNPGGLLRCFGKDAPSYHVLNVVFFPPPILPCLVLRGLLCLHVPAHIHALQHHGLVHNPNHVHDPYHVHDPNHVHDPSHVFAVLPHLYGQVLNLQREGMVKGYQNFLKSNKKTQI